MTYPAKIPVGEFKAKCLQLIQEVSETHRVIIITKRGHPYAKLIPYESEAKATEHTLFGYMRGSLRIEGDIIAPIDETWDAE